MIEKYRKPKKSFSGFRRVLIIWSAILTLTGIVLLVVLWQFMASYERSLPEKALSELTTSPEMLRSAASTGDAELDDYLYTLKLEGRELVCIKKAGEYSDAHPTYSLLADGRAYFTVSLSEGESTGFGMNSWQISRIDADPSYYATELHTLKVTVPSGAAVYVDGKLLGENYISKQGANYSTLNPYESGVDGLLCDIYTQEGLFAPPDVKVLFGDKALVGSNTDDYSYVFFPGDSHSITITAPDIAVVTVNGFILSEDHIVSRNEYSEINEYEKGMDMLPCETVFSLNGMYGEPVIEAHLDGFTLSSEQSGDNYIFAYPRKLLYSLTLLIPDGATAKLANSISSGKSFGADVLVSSGNPYDELTGLEGILGSIPTYSVYKLDGLYLEPEVAVSDSSGVLTLITNSGEGRTREFEFAHVSEAEHDTEALIALMRSYVEYTAYGSSETQAHFEAMLPYMMEGSPVLSLMRDSIESIKWNSVMTGINYNFIETTNFVDYSSDCYACELHCDVTLTRWSSEWHYDSKWEVVCVRQDSDWLVWKMQSIE